MKIKSRIADGSRHAARQILLVLLLLLLLLFLVLIFLLLLLYVSSDTDGSPSPCQPFHPAQFLQLIADPDWSLSLSGKEICHA